MIGLSMNGLFYKEISDVRACGFRLTEALPAALSFVDAVTVALDRLAESVATIPDEYQPPLTRILAARYLSISCSTLDTLRRDGKINVCGENGLPSASGYRRQVRYAKTELDRFLGGA